MAVTDRSLRVIGVSLPDVSDRADPVPEGKWSQFFHALTQRVDLVDVVSPRLSRVERYLNYARWFAPDRAAWIARAGFNLAHVTKLNARLEHELRSRAGSYDLIMQLQTLCSPRSASVSAPYAIYTDNTMALTQRHYRPFAPLPSSMVRDWLAFERDVCRAAQAVFTFSEFARRSMLEDYGVPPERVTAVGAGANQFLPVLEGKDYDRPRALFVGRPFEPKGGRVLLAAWRMVTRELPEAELTVVGPRSDPVPGGEPGVRWLGRLGRAALADEYAAASVFVLPSLFDAWGHVFVEAMGHGLPCIGTDCCAMPEIIEPGVTGLVVPRHDPEALAAALLSLLTDPGLASRMGEAGHARARERFTWDKVAERVVRSLAAA